jgi:hypothetical protein
MAEGTTNVAGIEIPSTDPIFLAVVGVHVLLGLACTFAGAFAMLSRKRPGRHPRYGTIYFWCLAGVFLTSTSLAAVRWAEDYHLFILGALSFAAAYLGRQARRQRWRYWVRLHIAGMGASYVLLLIALRGQRKAVAHLERPPPLHLLASASSRRDSPHHPHAVMAPVAKSAESALIERVHPRRFCICR